MSAIPCTKLSAVLLTAADPAVAQHFSRQDIYIYQGDTWGVMVDVTNEDAYMVPDRVGLTRVTRATGNKVWSNKTAVRFLCTNNRFVYAADAQGRLLVLDYNRGTELSR